MTLRIFMADDQFKEIKPAYEALKSQGYDVVSRDRFSEAFEKASAHVYDLAVIDLNWFTDHSLKGEKERRGWDLADEVRKHSPEAHLIIYTTFADDPEVKGDAKDRDAQLMFKHRRTSREDLKIKVLEEVERIRTAAEVLELRPGRSLTNPVVFGLHGIRTHAKWQKAFFEVASSGGLHPRIDAWDFGYFSALGLLLPRAREKKLKWFERTYYRECGAKDVGLREGERPSIVAHSFGTYLVAYALQRFEDIKFDRVLLCGSILPTDFDWQQLVDKGQVRRLRAEYGVRDPWVKLVGWFVSGAGPSGARGFAIDRPYVEHKEFAYDHSEYFRKGHMKDWWIPFFKGQDSASPTPRAVPVPGPRRPWLGYALAVFLAAVVVAGGLVAALAPSTAPTWSEDEALNRRILVTGGPMGPFYLQEHEVTNEEYRRFNTTHTFPGQQKRHPVGKVTWKEASAYAEWLGGRLPTEAEWDYAATGAGERIYPWGNEPADCSRAVLSRQPEIEGQRTKPDDWGCGRGGSWPVCSKPHGNTEQGLCDLAGNVLEWVLDHYDSDTYLARGGNFKDVALDEDSAYMALRNRDDAFSSLGFRVRFPSRPE